MGQHTLTHTVTLVTEGFQETRQRIRVSVTPKRVYNWSGHQWWYRNGTKKKIGHELWQYIIPETLKPIPYLSLTKKEAK